MNPQTAKLLIIDDSPLDRQLLGTVLRKNDFEVFELAQGDQWQKTLADHPDIALILLDVEMPVISGMDVLKQIRTTHSALELPVIMVTSKAESRDITQALGLGANDYVTKPVDFKIALMRVNNQLNMVRLSKEISQLKEMQAINALITTYNHEINNPLSIALLATDRLLKSANPEFLNYAEMLGKALSRITEIVKKIRRISEGQEAVEYATYAGATKMVKLHKG